MGMRRELYRSRNFKINLLHSFQPHASISSVSPLAWHFSLQAKEHIMQDDSIKTEKQLVKQMVATGVLPDEIAKYLKIPLDHLAEDYGEELEDAAIEANNQVLATLLQMATNGKNAAVTMFWCKVRCGWGFSPNKNLARSSDTIPPEDDPRNDLLEVHINDDEPNIII
jgi:hypothetical protein